MKKIATPYYLWDYNLDEKTVRQILKKGNEFSRNFIAARILESANYADVWKYFKLAELVTIFPDLKLKKEIRNAWKKALAAWGIQGYSF